MAELKRARVSAGAWQGVHVCTCMRSPSLSRSACAEYDKVMYARSSGSGTTGIPAREALPHRAQLPRHRHSRHTRTPPRPAVTSAPCCSSVCTTARSPRGASWSSRPGEQGCGQRGATATRAASAGRDALPSGHPRRYHTAADGGGIVPWGQGVWW